MKDDVQVFFSRLERQVLIHLRAFSLLLPILLV